jgi:hypothetical protein
MESVLGNGQIALLGMIGYRMPFLSSEAEQQLRGCHTGVAEWLHNFIRNHSHA